MKKSSLLGTVCTCVIALSVMTMHVSDAKPPKVPSEDMNENAILSLLTPKTIFVTSELYTGNLVYEASLLGSLEEDGLAAADYICQYHAMNAGLAGNYAAILSTSTVNANARITTSIGPYRLVTGTPVAENYSALFSTRTGYTTTPELPPIRLISSVYRDENGTRLSGPGPSFSKAVWTGSTSLGETPRFTSGGVTMPNLSTCFDWTVGDIATGDCGNFSTDNCGMTGLLNASDTNWLGWEATGCDVVHRLYCAQR